MYSGLFLQIPPDSSLLAHSSPDSDISKLLFFSVILRATQNFSQALIDNFSGDNFDYQVRAVVLT